MCKLTDITPADVACKPVGPTCPAVFKTERGTYVIVGRVTGAYEFAQLQSRVGLNEAAVEISAELLHAAIKKPLTPHEA